MPSTKATTFNLTAPGPVTQLKLDRFADYVDSYKSAGINTIVLNTSVPVDPNSGRILDAYTVPNLFNKSAVTLDYVTTFTDVARAHGVDVVWNPHFTLNNGRDDNVNDYFLGRTFYPQGNGFSVQTFLGELRSYWTKWAPAAQQHGVSLLVLGAEQGSFAAPQYTPQWLDIIQAARASYSGKLTYGENHFAPLPGEGFVNFWGALDVIGVDNYAIIGNGTANTSYAEAYHNIFSSPVFDYNQGARIDVPGALYNLHLKYGKPVFFVEFGTSSIDGAMNNPAIGGNLPTNFTEQYNYLKANFDVWQNYDWLDGVTLFNVMNEVSPSPSTAGYADFFNRAVAKSFEWWNKPAKDMIAGYWSGASTPPPIHASAAKTAAGAFAGTTALPDTLVGGFQGDKFDALGGVYVVYGGGGVDVAAYRGTASDFTISGNLANGLLVVSKAGAEGSGRLVDVERLLFSDKGIAFDTNGNAGEAYRLYQAAFDRTPDKIGLGYWIAQIDKGTSLRDVAASFIASQEFKQLNGSNPNNEAFTVALYQNVLHRAPDKPGFDYWTGELARGLDRATMLASFSESAENKVNVLGTIQNGIQYQEWTG